jgi:hypothetical protein
MDLGGAWRTAEDFLRRHIKSKAVREAERRRKERRRQAALRHGRNALLAGGASGAGGFGIALAAAPTVAALAAGGAALAGIVAAGWWTRRRSDRLSRRELAALPGEAEDWLLDKRPLLPRGAEPALDVILVHLADLPPFLALLHPNETLAWDARRLLGDHLPRLVDAWCSLPAVTRERDSEARRRLVEGLATLADELSRLTAEVSRDERMRLEAQSRFVESRYKDPETGV